MRQFRFMFLFLLFPFFSGAQSYPGIHFSRPRIYLDSARFAWLNANRSSGDCGVTYTAFVNAVNNNWYNDPQLYLLGNDSTLWTWDFNSGWATDEALFTASLYKITDDSLALKRCRFIITQLNGLYDTLDLATHDWYTNENYIRSFSDVGGVLFDWCYDDLPPAMKQHLAQNLYKVCRYFMNTYITSGAGNSYVSSHNAWNTIYANQYTLVLDSADGLTSAEMDTVRQWYRITYDKFENGFFPCYGYFRDDDGGWNWTAAYSMWSLVDQFQLFENMRIATGKDYYHDLGWVENSINQYWYFIQPDGWTINWGDGFTQLQGDRVIYRHAQIFNDPRSQWLAHYFSLPQNITWTWPLYQKLIYKDFTVPAVSKPDPPHDWWSDKTGLSVSRTSWDTSATLVWFYNAPAKKSAHEHRDNNSFSVYKNAPQIVNSGYYDSYGNSHYVNYYMRTIAHNSIVVFDSTDTYTNWGVPVSNDGGQTESPTLMNYNDIFSSTAQKGKWIQWGSGADYCYNIGDAHESYDTTKLDRFLRRVLFHKPEKILVLDHLHLKNILTNQRDARFILHFQNPPLISGTLVQTTVPGHIETFDGKDILQSHRTGNVAIRTLLPLNSRVKRIGGNDYEYYVEGTNYSLGSVTDTLHTTPGKWRIEVSPIVQTDSLVFFHTIKAGDDSNPSIAGGTLLANQISLAADWENTLYIFNAKGDTGSTYHHLDSVTGNRTLSLFAADLSRGILFDILVDHSISTSLFADTNGILEAQLSLGSGMHSLEIADHTLAVKGPPPADSWISIYPNPANDFLQIKIEETIPDCSLDIRTASGKLVKSIRTGASKILPLSNFSPGVYIITARAKNRRETLQFIVK